MPPSSTDLYVQVDADTYQDGESRYVINLQPLFDAEGTGLNPVSIVGLGTIAGSVDDTESYYRVSALEPGMTYTATISGVNGDMDLLRLMRERSPAVSTVRRGGLAIVIGDNGTALIAIVSLDLSFRPNNHCRAKNSRFQAAEQEEMERGPSFFALHVYPLFHNTLCSI